MNKNKLFVIITMIAIAFGTQSCSDDAPEYVKVTGITVTPDNTVLLINDAVTLVADVFPRLATDKSVTWKSDNPSVATVDDNGVVKAVAEGVANVSVTSVANSEKTKTCVVTVVATFDVSLNAGSLLLPVEAVRTLKVSVVPSNITQEVNWSSDNAAVATVDGGVITAIAPGTAKITASSVVDAGRTAECVVTVVDMSSTPAAKWLVGAWGFENASNLGKATVGADLTTNGNSFTSIEGPDGTKAVKLASNSYFTLRHDIGANGGGEYVNEYTLMMDIRGSSAEFSGWLSVFNNKANNDGDGALWIDGNGSIGYAPLGGYSSTGLTPDTWHRVTLVAKLGELFRVYIDGVLVFTASDNVGIDGMMSLYPDVLYIGYDGSGYPGPEFADVKMWNTALSDEDVAALGSPN